MTIEEKSDQSIFNFVAKDLHFPAVRILLWFPVPVMAVGSKTRDNVKMNMIHNLPGRSSVGLYNINAVGMQGFFLRVGYFLDNDNQFRQDFGRRFQQMRVMNFGNHKEMAFYDGTDIHENEGIVVLVDFIGRQFAADNFAKYAILHGC